MISTLEFAEDALARAFVPALSIDPSGSCKAHFFRETIRSWKRRTWSPGTPVADATPLLCGSTVVLKEFSFARTVELTYGKRMSIGRPSFRAVETWNSRGLKASLGSDPVKARGKAFANELS